MFLIRKYLMNVNRRGEYPGMSRAQVELIGITSHIEANVFAKQAKNSRALLSLGEIEIGPFPDTQHLPATEVDLLAVKTPEGRAFSVKFLQDISEETAPP
jgi:hypothetical protein